MKAIRAGGLTQQNKGTQHGGESCNTSTVCAKKKGSACAHARVDTYASHPSTALFKKKMFVVDFFLSSNIVHATSFERLIRTLNEKKGIAEIKIKGRKKKRKKEKVGEKAVENVQSRQRSYSESKNIHF